MSIVMVNTGCCARFWYCYVIRNHRASLEKMGFRSVEEEKGVIYRWMCPVCAKHTTTEIVESIPISPMALGRFVPISPDYETRKKEAFERHCDDMGCGRQDLADALRGAMVDVQA